MGISVAEDGGQSRFEIRVDGELAGFTTYEQREGAYAFLHTEIDPAYEGRGLGSRLIGDTLDQVRDRGASIQPHCSFVRGFVERHPDYLDLVPADRRERFGLPPEPPGS